jgi:hypothetical protein
MRVVATSSIFALFALSTAAFAASVVVGPGDTLSTIAKRELGSGRLWPQLCELNKAILPDCNILPVGGTILISPEPEVAVAAPVAKPVEPVAEAAPAAPAAPATEPAAPSEAVATPGAEAPAVAEDRTNLLAEAADFTAAYWSGYFVKPAIAAGKSDPAGGAGATQLASTDNEGGGYSGLLHAETTAPGTYTVGVWLRSVSGEQSFRYGLSDPYLAPEPAKVGEEWQYFQAVIEVSEETNRLFQIYEGKPGNAAWEIYGVSVEKGAFTTPFFPGK